MDYISNMDYSYKPFSNNNSFEDEGLNACFKIILSHRKKEFKLSQKFFIGGCGDVREAYFFQSKLNCHVVGVDFGLETNQISENISLYKRNIMDLSWDENEFDAVFSYHVLEHVGDPYLALQNLKKVLKKDEIMLIGFPNRKRLIGYIGSRDVNLKTKILWNINDYKSRILLKFKNKYGAHAGFSEKEFIEMSNSLFSDVKHVTNEYMLMKYESKSFLINLLIKFGFSRFLFPSLYFVCRK